MKLLKLVPDNTNIKFLKLRVPFFVLSLVLIIGSWAAVAVNGLNFGVDFAGGQEVRMTFEERETAPIPQLRELVEGLGYGTPVVQEFGAPNQVSIRVRPSSTTRHWPGTTRWMPRYKVLPSRIGTSATLGMALKPIISG